MALSLSSERKATMATIEKLPGKTGTTYRITVYSGFDTQGKRIRHRMAYKPTPGMTSPPGGKSRPEGGSGL